MNEDRLADIQRFYELMDKLEQRVGGARRLADCTGRLGWPQRGVYFFMEDGEVRSDSGSGPRIVRIGTHALRPSSSTLWQRLAQHRGIERTGGGRHRMSIFRLIVGTALLGGTRDECPTWDDGKNSAPAEVLAAEHAHECKVSDRIGAMRIIWLAVNDAPHKDSLRGVVERNAIALLSNYEKHPIDEASKKWLGRDCDRRFVKQSGLWNSNHVQEDYDPAFLDTLEALVEKQEAA